jgi:hypothetical protein
MYRSNWWPVNKITRIIYQTLNKRNIASIIIWYFMSKWMADFAYRIEMESWMFAAIGLTALAIAFLTVGF